MQLLIYSVLNVSSIWLVVYPYIRIWCCMIDAELKDCVSERVSRDLKSMASQCEKDCIYDES